MNPRIGSLLLLPFAVLASDCGPPNHRAPGAASTPAAVSIPLRPAAIDEAIRAAWKRENIRPARTVDDARFLRRAYLDITGVIPTAHAVSRFLADTSPDKRVRVVDALLASPRYAEHWTNYWDRVLLGREVKRKLVDRDAFRGFLEDRLSRNVGYDTLVYDLVTATGRSGVGRRGAADSGPPVNGAVNWFIKYASAPQDLTGATSKLFLGVQIQCAQCHDHKTEAWKTEDFRRLAAAFAETRADVVDPRRSGPIRRVDVSDTGEVAFKRKQRKDPELRAIAAATPTALDGTDLSKGPNPRRALAAWMTSPANPWFAKAIVNRLWSRFLGRGFVDPIADFRPGNPAVLPELLDALARDFVGGGYDIKRLIRLICATEVYQRSAAPASPSAGEDTLWSRFHVEPLGPDELFDSLVVAAKLEAVHESRNGARSLEEVREQIGRRFGFLFDVDEESDGDDFDGSISQALFLMNGKFVNNAAQKKPGSAVAEVLAMPGGDAPKIESLYLRALSRRPAADELATWTEYVGGRERREQKEAYEDLFWALVNSSEFAFNH